MTRQTRTESQASTRGQLLETAQRLFLSDGFSATSLEKVAAEAGFSKGAVYSNFANKDDLCLAVLDGIRAERITELVGDVVGAEGIEGRLAGFARWAEKNIGDEGWTALEVEFATTGRKSTRVRDEVSSRRRQITAAIASLLQSQADELGVSLPLPANDAAVTLLGLGIGLGVQRAIDPEVPVSPLVDLLRLLIEPARR